MRINYIFHKKIVTCVTRAKVTIYNFISGILLQSLVPRHRFLNLSIRPIKTECRVQKCLVIILDFFIPVESQLRVFKYFIKI